MEFVIGFTKNEINDNFDEVKSNLQAQLSAYKGIAFTEDTKKDAKDTIANLRKDKKALQDRVKAVKVEYMKPFEEFNTKAMELIGLYDEPINYINEQVTAFEEKRKEEKREQIQDIYHEIIPEAEWQAVLPLSKIANPKWENATTTAKSIKEEIMKYKQDAKTAYTAIKAMNSDKESEALEMYNRNYNLNECMEFLNRYEQQKKEVLEAERLREQREAEERIRREERERMAQERITADAIEEAKEMAKQETIESFIPQDNGEEVKVFTYMVKLTIEQKKTLEMYMDSVGIEYFSM
jgi:hypothetical protein